MMLCYALCWHGPHTHNCRLQTAVCQPTPTWQAVAKGQVCQLQHLRPRNVELGAQGCLLGQHCWVCGQHGVRRPWQRLCLTLPVVGLGPCITAGEADSTRWMWRVSSMQSGCMPAACECRPAADGTRVLTPAGQTTCLHNIRLACILGSRLRNWGWWLWCWLLWCQAQRLREAGSSWQQRPPEVLEQLRPVYLLRAALPLEQLRYALLGVEAPVHTCWQLGVGFHPAYMRAQPSVSSKQCVCVFLVRALLVSRLLLCVETSYAPEGGGGVVF